MAKEVLELQQERMSFFHALEKKTKAKEEEGDDAIFVQTIQKFNDINATMRKIIEKNEDDGELVLLGSFSLSFFL